MAHKTYYIDPAHGEDTNDGLDAARPLQAHEGLTLSGGDSVLFKRGSRIRGHLTTCCGSEGAAIAYGAYGEGELPTFLGSIAIGDPACWTEERPALWRYTGTLPSEACNLIFNNGAHCGNLRWAIEELTHPGEWHATGIGRSSEADGNRVPDTGPDTLYLCSDGNPGTVYNDIECALWGQRRLVDGQRHILLENLCFRNGGVHGYQDQGVHDVAIRNCEFHFIGGAVYHREKRIRFGNAVEFWDGASDITVEHCRFDNLYDSGVTHQGGETRNIPERLYFRHNHFSNYGMAAYESREPSRDIFFEHNTCINAGGGFSMQGEAPPRQSEIFPQPMGHHVFLWRIEPGTQPGNITISHNTFDGAPYGSAIYSIIDPRDEISLILDHNHYRQGAGEALIHMGERDYTTAEFADYQRDCSQDAHSTVEVSPPPTSKSPLGL